MNTHDLALKAANGMLSFDAEGGWRLNQKEVERFAHLVRAQTLEEAAGVTGEFAQKWWSMHCSSNKHMDTTRKAHDDFCALQAAIRKLKEMT